MTSQPAPANRAMSALPLPAVPGKISEKERRLFTSAKLDRLNWILRDPDPRMTPAVKLVALYLLQCVNSETLQCNPSYRTIADALGFKNEKTAARCVKALAKCCWIAFKRVNRKKSNRYVFLANMDRCKAIDLYQMDMSDKRADERLEHPLVSDRNVLEHQIQTLLERPPGSDKHLKGRTPEVVAGSEGKEGLKVSTDPSDNSPFKVPEGEEEAEELVMDWLDGQPPRVVIRLFDVIRSRLSTGTFTPAELVELLEEAA